MQIPADLVVLSACNTGLGRLAGGEGVQGLTRAFLHAGARRVVISLWEIRDRSTVDLMEGFYRALLGDRLAADETLRKAQIELIAGGASARDWAPFLLVGPAGPVPPMNTPWRNALAVLGALFLFAFWAILVAYARRSRRRPRP
jgi:CHAT domain-containing protein